MRLSNVTPEEVTAGVLFNDKGNPTKRTIESVVGELVAENGDEAAEVFQQIDLALESYRESATTDIGNIRVSDIDDYKTTIEIGANPVGSCQHYELGQENKGLLSYFDPSVKIVTVQNEKDRLVARAAMRIVDTASGPALLLEPTYNSQASDDIEASILDHAKRKAESMGIGLYATSPEGEKSVVTLSNFRSPALYSDVFQVSSSRNLEDVQGSKNKQKVVRVS